MDEIDEDGPTRSAAGGRLGVTRAELSALLLDQVVRPLIGDRVTLGSGASTCGVRAHGLRDWACGGLPPRAVFCDEAAAWVWVGGPAPTRVGFRVDKVHRVPAPRDPPLRARGGLPALKEVALLDGVRLTTPARTALDLLADAGDSALPVDTVRRLLRFEGLWELVGHRPPPEERVEHLGAMRRASALRNWDRMGRVSAAG